MKTRTYEAEYNFEWSNMRANEHDKRESKRIPGGVAPDDNTNA